MFGANGQNSLDNVRKEPLGTLEINKATEQQERGNHHAHNHHIGNRARLAQQRPPGPITPNHRIRLYNNRHFCGMMFTE